MANRHFSDRVELVVCAAKPTHSPDKPPPVNIKRSISARRRAAISTAWRRKRRPASSIWRGRFGACGKPTPRNPAVRRAPQSEAGQGSWRGEAEGVDRLALRPTAWTGFSAPTQGDGRRTLARVPGELT